MKKLVLGLLVAALAAAGSATTAGAAASSRSAASSVRVRLVEFRVILSIASAPAGKVTFVVANAGKIAHDFVVLRTNLAPGKLPVAGNVAKEVGRQGKIPIFGPRQTRRLALTLRPGKYVLICNVAGHYKLGMFAGFRVR